MYMYIVGRNDDELICSRDRWKLNIVFLDSCIMYLFIKVFLCYVVLCIFVLSGFCSQLFQLRFVFFFSFFLIDFVLYNFDLKIQFMIISCFLYNLFCILCFGCMFGVLLCLVFVQFFIVLFRYFFYVLLYFCKLCYI